MLGFIYYLRNPTNQEIFYVGATQCSLTNRLRTHYQHLREFERGLRKPNRRYEYLAQLRPNKAEIVLLEIVEDNVFQREKHYIDIFRELYPLTNMTDGGTGGNTYKYQDPEDQKRIGDLISVQHKGKPKPAGFAENMSAARTGKDNPRAGHSKIGWTVCFTKERVPIRMFKFGFEVNAFTGSKSSYSSVTRTLQNKPPCCITPYGYYWEFFDKCSKEVQDIVEAHYESLG